MIDYNTPRFKTSEVAAAAGIPAATFRSYFKREQFRVIGEMSKKADIFGLPNMFSLRDALGFAVALRLISAGASPKDAWEVAMLDFAHSGDEDRGPAELFDIHERGETYLIFWPDIGKGKLVASDDIGLPHNILKPSFNNMQEAAIFLTLNYLEARVFKALGVTK